MGGNPWPAITEEPKNRYRQKSVSRYYDGIEVLPNTALEVCALFTFAQCVVFTEE